MTEDGLTPPRNPGDEETESLPSPSRTHGSIGPYKILETLGEGGMGIVYLAEQVSPIRRRVALKVIKPGMDSKQVLARFESERQALALMNHPNIAKVYDAGATDQGHPYFVMEHVAGVPITEYCDKHMLANRERLELFTPICEAIQHAHNTGIIHRDIKPSNVLVTVRDGKPVPKVIDFGVAKATSLHLTERTLFTEQGVLIGTPEYMSPEQAEMTALDVDSRTDIYSLGVLLYELLVGALPFDPISIRQAGYAEMQRIIREEEPATPSARITTLGARASEIARRRRMNVRSLRKELRGDLDRISLKALAKDRTRRYASALEFSADIGRHIRGERVLAGRPRRLIFLRRSVRATPPLMVVLIVVAIAWIEGMTEVTLPSRHQLELRYYDFLLSKVRGPLPPPAEVAIVAMDDDSCQKLGVDPTGPWPRRLHADLIRTLKQEGVRVVAFDIFFEGARDMAQDNAFKVAVAEAGNVVLGSVAEQIDLPRFQQTQLSTPFAPFAAAAAAIGELDLPVDRDGVIRSALLSNQGRPSLALAAYEVATGDRTFRDERLRLIDFSGPARSMRTVPFYQALDPLRHLPPGFFSGKIVFVGLSQPDKDSFRTPFGERSGRSTFGVEIHANILSSLLRGSWIETCSQLVEWLTIGGVLVAALGLGLAPWAFRTRIFALLGLVLGYGLLGSVAFVHFRYWLPMIGPLAVMLIASGLGLWVRRHRGRRGSGILGVDPM